MLRATQIAMPKLRPDVKLKTPRLHSGVACDKSEIIEIPLPIPEVVWQQPTETITDQVNLNNTNNDSIIHYTHEKTTVASQASPPKGIQPQNYVVSTEQPPGKQTGNEPIPFLKCSKNCPIDIQNSGQQATTILSGDTTIPPLTITKQTY